MDRNRVLFLRFILEDAPEFADCPELSVLLQSPGGYAAETYRMLLDLRNYVDDIEVLVPYEAKSAATLFCLGSNEIYMGLYGELGPLDPQILDRTGSPIRSSALKSFKALEQLLEHSLSSLSGIVRLLPELAPMDVPNAIDHAKPLFASIASPLYEQIDPHRLGEEGMYLAEIEEYAVRAMQRRDHIYQDELPSVEDADEQLRELAHKLVWDYPSHDFVIDLQEAKSINLNAESLDIHSDALGRQILNQMSSGPFFGVGRFEGQAAQDDSALNQ